MQQGLAKKKLHSRAEASHHYSNAVPAHRTEPMISLFLPAVTALWKSLNSYSIH